MLTELQVFNPRVTVAPFAYSPGGSASTDPLQIRDIEGLGPVPGVINTIKYGSFDGEAYNDSTVGKRNIVLTVGLNPDWSNQTVASLRQLLYSYFMPKSRLRLRFKSEVMPETEIVGYVETVEPNIFSEDPEFQVSIICPDPYFTATQATIVSGTTERWNGVETVDVDYPGTVDTGFVLNLYSDGALFVVEDEVIQVYNYSPLAEIFVGKITATPNYYGEISTVSGAKYVRRYPTIPGPPVSLMRGVAPASVWVQLHPGMNKIKVLTESANMPWTLSYYAKFGGL